MHRRDNKKYDKNIQKCVTSKMPIDLELEPDINVCISKPKIHIFNHAICKCKKEHTGSCSRSRSRSRSDSCSSVKSESSVSSKKSGCSCNYRRGRTRHRDCKKKDYKDKSYKIEKCKKTMPITADINIDNKINNIINIKIK